jgi:hypothetical protein
MWYSIALRVVSSTLEELSVFIFELKQFKKNEEFFVDCLMLENVSSALSVLNSMLS